MWWSSAPATPGCRRRCTLPSAARRSRCSTPRSPAGAPPVGMAARSSPGSSTIRTSWSASSAVRRLEWTGEGWRARTAAGHVTARRVILATNAYTDDLWPGLRHTVLPVQSYQVATQPLPEDVRRRVLPGGQVVSDLRRILFYFRLDPEGRLLMGGRGPLDDRGDPALFARLEAVAQRLVPQIRAPAWEHRWGGRVALTADHLPHLHEPRPRVLIGLGYNGRGIAMATVMGKGLADRALGASPAEIGWPVTAIQPIPLHRWRLPAMALVVHWKRFQDWLDAR